VNDVGTSRIDLIAILITSHAYTLSTASKVWAFGVSIGLAVVGIIAFVDVNTWLASVAVFASASEWANSVGAIFIGTTRVCFSAFIDVCALTDLTSTFVARLTCAGERLVNVATISQGVTVMSLIFALIGINTVCLGGVTLLIDGELKSRIANASGAQARATWNTSGRWELTVGKDAKEGTLAGTVVVSSSSTFVEIDASSVVGVHLPAIETVANVGANGVFTLGIGWAVWAHAVGGFIDVNAVSVANVGGFRAISVLGVAFITIALVGTSNRIGSTHVWQISTTGICTTWVVSAIINGLTWAAYVVANVHCSETSWASTSIRTLSLDTIEWNATHNLSLAHLKVVSFNSHIGLAANGRVDCALENISTHVLIVSNSLKAILALTRISTGICGTWSATESRRTRCGELITVVGVIAVARGSIVAVLFISIPSEEGVANTAVVAAACVSVASNAEGSSDGDIIDFNGCMMLGKRTVDVGAKGSRRITADIISIALVNINTFTGYTVPCHTVAARAIVHADTSIVFLATVTLSDRVNDFQVVAFLTTVNVTIVVLERGALIDINAWFDQTSVEESELLLHTLRTCALVTAGVSTIGQETICIHVGRPASYQQHNC
jgi:hypothetical protein